MSKRYLLIANMLRDFNFGVLPVNQFTDISLQGQLAYLLERIPETHNTHTYPIFFGNFHIVATYWECEIICITVKYILAMHTSMMVSSEEAL